MTRILLDRGVTDFKWGNCLGSDELYFRVGYYDKFFSDYEYDDFLERTGQLLLPEFYNDNYRVIYCYEK